MLFKKCGFFSKYSATMAQKVQWKSKLELNLPFYQHIIIINAVETGRSHIKLFIYFKKNSHGIKQFNITLCTHEGKLIEPGIKLLSFSPLVCFKVAGSRPTANSCFYFGAQCGVDRTEIQFYLSDREPPAVLLFFSFLFLIIFFNIIYHFHFQMSNSLFYLYFFEAPILTQDSCKGHMFRF